MRHRSSGDLGRIDAVEPASVIYGWGGDVVESRSDSAVQGDEAREVGEEARRLVLLDLAVLDRLATKI